MKIKPLEIFTIKRIFDFIKIPIFAIDTEKEILMWNTSMAEFSNISSNKIIGKKADGVAEKIYPNSKYFLSDYFINPDIREELKDNFEIVEFEDHIVGIPKCMDNNYLIIKASPLFDKRDRLIGVVELIISFDKGYGIEESQKSYYEDLKIYIAGKQKKVRDNLKEILKNLGVKNIKTFNSNSKMIGGIFKSKPNLIILDLGLSKGERIAKAVKENFPDIRIAVWGEPLDDTNLRNELKACGVEFFIDEPFIEDKIEKLLINENGKK